MFWWFGRNKIGCGDKGFWVGLYGWICDCGIIMKGLYYI